ncbi:LCP family protein [Desulfitobacterium metallireducens]|uniref:Transcriptional regulator n=1 Tax=Desulfitobacterium metallireducens DSM 15288 TaxID=871968 RepID=W0ECS4_9FIRM|nr:LCP family protein [Desulfitobacterium metallireducens]AHF07318.1 transcriptional regulator [Desulfitobacterium metallireducens DSM 15288]
MPKDKKKASSLEFFKVYGVNAILGFGLGVGIVLLALTLWGRGQVGKIFSAETQPSQRVNQTAKDEKASPQDKVNETVESFNSSRFTVLLIGMDNRPEETSLCNTDSLLVASIDQSNERLTFLSIPRDTQVDLPGVDIQKINAIARVKNGFSATQKYVETMIGYPIDGYVATNFNGFKSIIDSLGGITLNVEKNMHYDTGDSQDRYIDLKKGTQRLTGSQALQYARFRNDEMGDISRTARQQAVVKAIFKEATELENLPKLPFAIPKVYQSVQTDLSISQIWSLASLLKKTEQYQIVSQTLPGKFAIEKGISYWKVNSNQVQKVVTQLFLEGKTTSVFGQENRSKGEVKKQDNQKNQNQNSEEKSSTQNIPTQNPNQEIQFEVMEN